MRFTPHDKTSHSVVPEKFRCVWMTAGIFSYQLCDRQFDCDHCPLDAAMRMHFSHDSTNRKTGERRPQPKVDSEKIEKILYSSNHCWIKIVDKNIARVGLETRFASILISPKAIALPSIGDPVKRSDFCCWIILEGGALPLRSPLEGTIISTNARITDEPHTLCAYPLTHGWLFEVQFQEKELISSSLLKRENADKLYSEDFSRFNNLLKESFEANRKSVGETLADGGHVQPNVSLMLGPKRYFELISRVFRS